MKLFKSTIALALAMTLAFAVPASAQIRFGVKAGVAINKLHFSNDAINENFNSNNRSGFTGGVMTEIGLPLTGLCLDASLLYTHRSGEVVLKNTSSNVGDETFKRDYIDIPINLKYKFSFLGTGNFIAPFLTTGPDLAILVSDKGDDFLENKRSVWGRNFGFGVELLKHLQVAASYGCGLSKSINDKIKNETGVDAVVVDGKDHCWTISAAYLF